MNIVRQRHIPYSVGLLLLLNSLCLLFTTQSYAQTCEIPFLNRFEASTTNGFTVIWDDPNSDTEYYELEYGIKGFSRSFEADISNITGNSHVLSDLESGNTYELYLRAICMSGDSSDWNGPYFNNTVIDNSSACGISLDITDHNCPVKDAFLIEVDIQAGLLISDSFQLNSVDLIIEHSWPADLDIDLISPSGRTVALSSFIGNGIANYGDPLSSDCSVTASFSDRSCLRFNSDQQQGISGSLLSEDNMNEILIGEPVNGTWRLSVCDRADFDFGKILYAHLNFEFVECSNVRNFVIENLESEEVEFKWDNTENCQNLRLEYNETLDPSGNGFVDYVECFRESYIIDELKSGTEYKLLVFAECGIDLESEALCEIIFTTSEFDASVLEDFDTKSICEAACESNCLVSDYWKNDTTNDNNDWIVYSDPSPSANTGPEADYNACGNYLYSETSLQCNQGSSIAILESVCLLASGIADTRLSFYCHMNVYDDSELILQMNSNETDWVTLLELKGDQGKYWREHNVEINSNTDHFRLRFISANEDSRHSDIALDHIKLIGIDTVPLSVLYKDEDNDGFGNPDKAELFCSSEILVGYVSNDLDCDDQNPLINPDQSEIFCNGMDDNCDGSDDVPTDLIDYDIVQLIESSCSGMSDGSIELDVTSSNPIVEYLWSNGATGSTLLNVSAGSYRCTITDTNDCSIITDWIELSPANILSLDEIVIMEASCSSASDGSISVNVSGGIEPYEYVWSDGQVENIASSLSPGIYSLSISDAIDCYIEIKEIELLAQEAITTGIINLSHESCFGNQDGIIRVGAFGGSPPYEFNWSNGSSGSMITGLEPGVYGVTITDTDNCQEQIDSIEIREGSILSAEIISIDDVSCFGEDDSFIDMNVTGGTPPYSFVWSDGSLEEDLRNKPAGIYSVSVTDSKACSIQISDIEIKQNEELTILLDSINNLRCTASSNGYLGVDINGGVPDYNYFWSTGTGLASDIHYIDSLAAGRYSLTVTDKLGCKSLLQNLELINLNSSINISLLALDSISCHDESDASLIAVVNNAVLPLDYNWSAGRQEIRNMFSDTIYDLSSSKYNLTITDSEGCVGISDSIEVINPQELEFELIELQNNLCAGDQNAFIELISIGGTEPVEIAWSNGSFDFNIYDLNDGSYNATITDHNGCTITTSEYFITSPEPLHLDIEVVDSDASNNGMISVIVTGGEAPYIYNWVFNTQGEIQDSIASNLEPGEYYLEVFDSNSCMIDSLIIVEMINSNTTVTLEAELQLFPNPNFGEFNYSYPDHWSLENLELVNVNGKRLDYDIDARNKHIRLKDDTVQGVYFMVAQFKEFRLTKKLIFIK